MTPLERIIRAQIASTGPMPLDQYMALCLAHPEHGYYTTKDPLGAKGDFTTAPEISQMFGEMAGLAFAQYWRETGAPAPLPLIEPGPGRGRLMADLLRAAKVNPAFAAALEPWFVEISSPLRAAQEKAAPEAKRAARLEDTPEGPFFLIANEFFDALPVRQFIRKDGRWAERMVTVTNDALAWGLRAAPALTADDAPEGAIFERCPAGEAAAALIGRRIAVKGGCAVIIDYGYSEHPAMGADTVQAMRAHQYANPLDAPGETDLTAHVDFSALTRAARAEGAKVSAVITQGEWLTRLGLGQRAASLAAAHPARAEQIASELERLTDPADMGGLFKVIAIYAEGAPVPPGFDEEESQ